MTTLSYKCTSPTGRHKYKDGTCVICSRNCFENRVLWNTSQLKPYPSLNYERTEQLRKTGHCTIPPREGEEWDHYFYARWFVANKEWTCSVCESKIPPGYPYYQIKLAQEDGHQTSNICCQCAIHEYDALEKIGVDP